MRLDDTRREALKALYEELGEPDEKDGPVSETTRLRFEKLQARMHGVVKRKVAAERLQQMRALVRGIREGLRGEPLSEAIAGLQLDLAAGNPELVACYRSLQERKDGDEEGMLEDLLVLQRLMREEEGHSDG